MLTENQEAPFSLSVKQGAPIPFWVDVWVDQFDQFWSKANCCILGSCHLKTFWYLAYCHILLNFACVCVHVLSTVIGRFVYMFDSGVPHRTMGNCLSDSEGIGPVDCSQGIYLNTVCFECVSLALDLGFPAVLEIYLSFESTHTSSNSTVMVCKQMEDESTWKEVTDFGQVAQPVSTLCEQQFLEIECGVGDDQHKATVAQVTNTVLKGMQPLVGGFHDLNQVTVDGVSVTSEELHQHSGSSEMDGNGYQHVMSRELLPPIEHCVGTGNDSSVKFSCCLLSWILQGTIMRAFDLLKKNQEGAIGPTVCLWFCLHGSKFEAGKSCQYNVHNWPEVKQGTPAVRERLQNSGGRGIPAPGQVDESPEPKKTPAVGERLQNSGERGIPTPGQINESPEANFVASSDRRILPEMSKNSPKRAVKRKRLQRPQSGVLQRPQSGVLQRPQAKQDRAAQKGGKLSSRQRQLGKAARLRGDSPKAGKPKPATARAAAKRKEARGIPTKKRRVVEEPQAVSPENHNFQEDSTYEDLDDSNDWSYSSDREDSSPERETQLVVAVSKGAQSEPNPKPSRAPSERSHPEKTRRRDVQTPQLAGQLSAFEDYLTQIVADYSGWREVDEGFQLWNNLTGNSRMKVRNLPLEESLVAVMSLMRGTFGSVRTKHAPRSRRLLAKSDPKLDIDTFAHHMLDLSRNAYTSSDKLLQERSVGSLLASCDTVTYLRRGYVTVIEGNFLCWSMSLSLMVEVVHCRVSVVFRLRPLVREVWEKEVSCTDHLCPEDVEPRPEKVLPSLQQKVAGSVRTNSGQRSCIACWVGCQKAFEYLINALIAQLLLQRRCCVLLEVDFCDPLCRGILHTDGIQRVVALAFEKLSISWKKDHLMRKRRSQDFVFFYEPCENIPEMAEEHAFVAASAPRVPVHLVEEWRQCLLWPVRLLNQIGCLFANWRQCLFGPVGPGNPIGGSIVMHGPCDCWPIMPGNFCN